ncbi:MAG TPA: DNA polymerase III subunit epsilon, partial [Gammaproteobacteria bacterium]|nr:DNA polymerase III subunit epsilon [Gammaproteobacteria bacterium]
PLRIVAATADELESHEACLNEIDEASDGGSLWRRLDKA